jgi:hypothetical protein
MVLGVAAVLVALVVYWLSARLFDAGRPDLFYLADAFTHGRVWLERGLGPADVIVIDGKVYVPFAPFPAIAFIPLVALIGPALAHAWEPLINAGLAAVDVGLVWMPMGRLGVRSLSDRFWLDPTPSFRESVAATLTYGVTSVSLSEPSRADTKLLFARCGKSVPR